jgi:stearoyl-CoA desaturase (delta-9 desaturase)
VALLDRVLDRPSYGFTNPDGTLCLPTQREIFREFFTRLNVFRTRLNWLPFFGWFATVSLVLPLGIFLTHYFSWPLFFLGLTYSMVALGSHGTFWLHRYSTHQAFRFKHAWVRTLCRNLVIRIIPEEIYVVSHHVHHAMSEKPGDPYNVHGGWLYCFLADVTHQTLNKTMSEKDYDQVLRMMNHTGVRLNSYTEFQKWGSACHPFFAIGHYVLNWGFWYAAFYWIGGHALATAIFGLSGVWAFGVRTYNYDGHGRGQDRRQDGVDFYRGDYSVNQMWPGYVAGEWHNNHHLFPQSARCGFLPYQIDNPWTFIRLLESLGQVHSIHNSTHEFLTKYAPPAFA